MPDEPKRTLYARVRPPYYDGHALHFQAEWSEHEHDWTPVYLSSFVIAGWIDAAGRVHMDPTQLAQALEAEEARVEAYLEAKRNPPQLPPGLDAVFGRPVTTSAVRRTCESCAMTRHEVPVRDDAVSKEGSSR